MNASGGTLGYTGERPIGFDQRLPGGNLDELPQYTTVDLRSGLEFDRWAFEVYVSNLTDKIGVTSAGTDNTIAFPPASPRFDLCRVPGFGLELAAQSGAPARS